MLVDLEMHLARHQPAMMTFSEEISEEDAIAIVVPAEIRILDGVEDLETMRGLNEAEITGIAEITRMKWNREEEIGEIFKMIIIMVETEEVKRLEFPVCLMFPWDKTICPIDLTEIMVSLNF